MAATFNRSLTEQAARKAAAEIRSAGTHWTFAPCVDIVCDARWGRTGETYGEDPFLASEMVRAAVKGLQDNPDPAKRVAASVKHLAAGGVSAGGVNHASAEISERFLRSYILPPFKAAVEAGCMTIMPGHNDIGGIPCHASRWLLTDVVKGEFGFGGFFISDMMDMDNLTSLHFTAENQSQALEKSINAGMDMHMYSPDSLQFAVPVRQLVREGKIPMSRIDDAVRRILKVKFSLGLFENRYTDPAADRYATPDSRRTALEAARECVVLLKNEGNLLPLDTTKYRRILVTGPNADNQAILGDWSFTQPDSCVVTVLEGMRRTAGGTEIAFCNSGKIKPEPALERTNTTDPALQRKILEKGGGISDFSIREAVRMAAACDLTVVVIGGYGIRSDWGLRTYGESGGPSFGGLLRTADGTGAGARGSGKAGSGCHHQRETAQQRMDHRPRTGHRRRVGTGYVRRTGCGGNSLWQSESFGKDAGDRAQTCRTNPDVLLSGGVQILDRLRAGKLARGRQAGFLLRTRTELHLV